MACLKKPSYFEDSRLRIKVKGFMSSTHDYVPREKKIWREAELIHSLLKAHFFEVVSELASLG